jgi:hypothetical protein
MAVIRDSFTYFYSKTSSGVCYETNVYSTVTFTSHPILRRRCMWQSKPLITKESITFISTCSELYLPWLVNLSSYINIRGCWISVYPCLCPSRLDNLQVTPFISVVITSDCVRDALRQKYTQFRFVRDYPERSHDSSPEIGQQPRVEEPNTCGSTI